MEANTNTIDKEEGDDDDDFECTSNKGSAAVLPMRLDSVVQNRGDIVKVKNMFLMEQAIQIMFRVTMKIMMTM